MNDLQELKIDEIAFVDKGAGKGVRVALFKRNTNKEEMNKMKSLEELMASLSEEDAAIVMQAIVEASKEKETEKADEEKEKMKEEEKDKAHTPEHKEEKGMNYEKEEEEEVAKRLSVLKSENIAMRDRIAKMEQERERETFIKRAEAYPNIPGFNTEDLGDFLMLINKKLPGYLAEKTEGMIKSVNAMGEDSSLLKSFGATGVSRTPTGSALATAESMAKSLMQNEPGLSKAQALNRVWETNTDLRKQYRNERRGR
jgi:hypothetical protein